jgi:hypothetical protein
LTTKPQLTLNPNKPEIIPSSLSEKTGQAQSLLLTLRQPFGVMNPVMARPLRIQYAGARYHVMSRGDRREAIFYNDADRVEFLRTLGQACLKSDRLGIGSASYVSNLLSSVDSKL